MLHGDHRQERSCSARTRKRSLVAREGGADQIDVDPRSLVAQPGPDRRPSAAEPGDPQRLHRSGQISGVDEEVDVPREPLVAVLEHGETACNGEWDSGVPQDLTDARERLVDGADGHLAQPCGLEELAIGSECRGAHLASRLLPTPGGEPSRPARLAQRMVRLVAE